MESKTINCQNCKKDFIIEPDDFNFYEKIKVPAPTWCPECRLIRRLVWRNDRYLSKVNCGLCSQSTFSAFTQDSGYTIYCANCFRNDDWDPMQYGQDYDFSKPFFVQFAELMKKIPVRARFISSTPLINSDYTNMVSNLKNCYLIYNSDYDENCMYGTEIENSKDCVDNTMIDNCQQSYESVNCQKCYKTFFSTDCSDSSDIWFSYDLVGCLNCFGCVGLRNKNYYIFNQPCLKDDYQEKIKELFSGSREQISRIQTKVREIYLKIPRRYMHGRQNANVSGDYIYNSKDTKNSFVGTEARNCRYCMWMIVPTVKDSWDYTEWGNQAEQMYETISSGENVSQVKFSNQTLENCMNVEYSYACRSVQNIFGCNGVRKKSYCILNKQYTKEKYEELILKIKKHMEEMPYVDGNGRIYKYGEFFPLDLAPFAYNQSSAQEFFPLGEKAIKDSGYTFKVLAEKNYMSTINQENLPDSIKDISDSFINEVIECAEWGNEKAKEQNCTKAFRITVNELNFYKNHNLPLPNRCPNCRHFTRIKRRNPNTFWHRECMCEKEGHSHEGHCPNEFETSYAPNRPEIVYCEKCYQQEIY
jgi:hypothetical protein